MISATLEIWQARDDADFQNNKMIYRGYGIGLCCVLPSKEFNELLTNIRSGLTPSSVSVALPIKYHGYPDADTDKAYALTSGDGGFKWDNEWPTAGAPLHENNFIKHEGITLNYGLLKSTFDYEMREVKAPEATLTDVVDAQRQLRDQLVAISMFGGLLFVVIAIAALYFLRH